MYFLKLTLQDDAVLYLNMAQLFAFRKHPFEETTLVDVSDGSTIKVKETPDQILAALPDQSLVRPS